MHILIYSALEPKPVVWQGSSRADVRGFPEPAQHRIGGELWFVQLGLNPADWKPMPVVGPGVREMRVHAGGEFRVLYVAHLAKAVYVLHAFHKKSRKTPKSDIEVARQRLRSLPRP